GAYGNGSAAPVRGAAARRAPHALGFPARARWRVEGLGDSERAEPGGRRAEDGRPDRGPPARLRGGRGRDAGARRLVGSVHAQREDHALECAGFEGVIPQGEYGGGTVVVWDRGFWHPIGDPRRGLA